MNRAIAEQRCIMDMITRILEESDRVAEGWSRGGKYSTKEFYARKNLYRGLLALRRVQVRGVAFKVEFMCFGEEIQEEYLGSLKPLVTPVSDKQMNEWFSDPKKARPILAAKVKEFRENLKLSKEAWKRRRRDDRGGN